MSRVLLHRVVLLAATTMVMLFVLEVAVREFYPVPPTWVEPQVTHLESPLLGWVLPPGLKAYTIDAPVTINSLGYRDNEIQREKPTEEFRILALGDSFTFALGVRFEDLWVQQLERALAARYRTAVEVINSGVAGYNTRQEFIFLEHEGWNLEPDLIVVAFYWNDLVGNSQPLPDLVRTPKVHPETLVWERHARAQHHRIPMSIRNKLRKSVLLYQIGVRAKDIFAGFQPPGEYQLVQQALLTGDDEHLETYFRATRKRLLQIADSAAARSTPVILMLFPMENEIQRNFPKMRLKDELEKIWGPTTMPFVDLTSAFQASQEEGGNPFLPYDLHPNSRGMRIASERLLEVIKTEAYIEVSSPTSDPILP